MVGSRLPSLLHILTTNGCPESNSVDYYSYALHNLIESTFGVIKSKVNKKEWVEAFYAIEALTVFFDFESDWTSEFFFVLRSSTTLH